VAETFVRDCDGAEDIEHNWKLAIDALSVSAEAWAIATKELKWMPEHEVRGIFLARSGRRIEPTEERRPDGSIKRYVAVPLTAHSGCPSTN